MARSRWSVRRTLRLLPGVRLNVSRAGLSLTVGGRGLTFRVPLLGRPDRDTKPENQPGGER